MQVQNKLTDSKEVGLAVGLLIGENLLGMKDLHYGLWEENEPLSVANLLRAQEKYSAHIISKIPQTTMTILDVGSGSGKLANLLIDKGFQVDCVSPSPFLTGRLGGRIRNQGTIYPVKFEDLAISKKYDLVLFSESFQYVNPHLVLEKCPDILNPNGTVIISDFFKKPSESNGPLGGGHLYTEFLEKLRPSRFQIIENSDITEQTAPTMELFNQLLNNTALPIKNLVVDFISHRHPYLSKFLSWKLKKRFAKLNSKYFSNELGAETFKKYKTYRFFVLKVDVGASTPTSYPEPSGEGSHRK